MRSRHWLWAILLATSSVASAKTTPYWVCTESDGVRVAQDRPCGESQTTIRTPPGLKPAIPAAPPQRAEPLVDARPPTPPPQAAVAPIRPAVTKQPITAPFQRILDVVFRGLLLIALLVIAILGLRVLFSVRNKGDRKRSRVAPRREPEQRHSSWSERMIDTASDPTDLITGPAAAPVVTRAHSSWSVELLKALDWKRFEELCQRYWVLKGFPAELTGPGADGGIDIRIAERNAPQRTFAVAQCKAWTAQQVDVETVRALWGVCAHFEAKLGLFYSIAGFTEPAKRFADGKHLKLIDGSALLQQIATLPTEQQQTLLAEITRGDYTTPSCPNCESRLALNPKRPGWWSCPRYPRCRYRGMRISKAGAAKP